MLGLIGVSFFIDNFVNMGGFEKYLVSVSRIFSFALLYFILFEG